MGNPYCHINILQVSPQLSCHGVCELCLWLAVVYRGWGHFYKWENNDTGEIGSVTLTSGPQIAGQGIPNSMTIEIGAFGLNE